MLKIILCDDNPLDLNILMDQLKCICQRNDIEVAYYPYSNVESMFFDIENNLVSFDVLFLDILIGDSNGIEYARKIQTLGIKSEIVFISSSEKYVFDALDLFPTQYLLKGQLGEERLEQTLFKAMDNIEKTKAKTFVCKMSNETKLIDIKDIFYFEIFRRQVTVYYNDTNFTFYSTLDQVLHDLNDQNFIRCHRSFIINLKKITSLNTQYVTLTNGKEIDIGRSYKKQITHAFDEYLESM